MSPRPIPPPAPTLSDVAKRAGVSLATASRVLNGSNRSVGAELAQSVLAAAEELAYSPHGPAQAMARGHTSTIGLLAPDIADPFFTQLSAGATDAAGDRRMMVSVAVHHAESDTELRLVRAFRSQRARGLVIAGSRRRHADETALVEAVGDLPAVMLGQRVAPLPTIGFANEQAGVDLARALARLGYRQVLLVAGPDDHLTSVERCQGIVSATDELGLDHRVVHGAFSRDGGHQALTSALSGPDQVAWLTAADRARTVVVAATDMMALGAMTALHEAGMCPGQDVAVAGFNDLPLLADVRPGLTTVRFPLREAGRAAVEVLLGSEAPEARLTGQVVVRDSTPPR